MTAVSKYSRLESMGLWRETPDGQRREVIVRMGDATLTLTDPRSDAVLSHWSLPATLRKNPGKRPAVYAPGEDAEEELEVGDTQMIEALKTVHSALKRADPRPGRLRSVLTWGTTLAILGVAAWVLPGVLVQHTASVVPAAKRAEVGQLALDDITRLTGAPCDGDLGLPALAKLAERVFGPVDTPIFYILPEGLARPSHLPGGVILLPRALVEIGEGPEALAGAALAEGVAAKATDPMLSVLNHAGIIATFRLLTTGELPEGALAGYGEAFVKARPAPPAPADLIPAFEAAQIPLTPYAEALAAAGQSTDGLVDPFKGLIPSPLLPDSDWIALQSVCSG
jgi:hypothetical protein